MISIDPTEQPIADVVRTLRKAVVEEWLGENTGSYQSFLTSDQLHEQAQSFLNSGTFAGDIGDLVVRALANALKVPIVVFTSVENMPTIVVTPPNVVTENVQPLHLATMLMGLATMMLLFGSHQIRSQSSYLKKEHCLSNLLVPVVENPLRELHVLCS